jgi:hypothetical protein
VARGVTAPGASPPVRLLLMVQQYAVRECAQQIGRVSVRSVVPTA